MPRTRRMIKSGAVYEVCFRARDSLPLGVHRLIKFIIGASLARTQRDDKITLCHDIWNGSHPHFLLVAKDANQLIAFVSEIQKRITDAMKRLLGYDQLNIWEGYPMIAEVADLDKAKERIAYFYANPAQDDLEDTIERFPGYSSYRGFLGCQEELGASFRESYPWIRLPSIPRLSSRYLTDSQDRGFVKLLEKKNKKGIHVLERKPNAWMECFGIESDEEVASVNRDILSYLGEKEKVAREKREGEGKRVMGARALREQPILKEHKPKKRSRKIFVLASTAAARKRVIRELKNFVEKCRECYQAWLQGDFTVVWPPGAFKPPLPPNASLLA